MQALIKHEPHFPVVTVDLAPAEELVADYGAMVARAPAIDLHVRLCVGRRPSLIDRVKALGAAFIRRMLGSRGVFLNHFSSMTGGWVRLASPMGGPIKQLSLREGARWNVAPRSFIAYSGPIDMQMRWGSLKAVFSRGGVQFLDLSGEGELWLAGYGAIDEVEVNGSYVIDSGHIVAFEKSLHFDIRHASGHIGDTPIPGEGLVLELSGNGKVLVQTRNLGALTSWVGRQLP
jgi:uncharacterized protein (TIGR00266 family)